MPNYSIVARRRDSHGRSFVRYYVEWHPFAGEEGSGKRRRRIQLAHLSKQQVNEKAINETGQEAGEESPSSKGGICE